MSEANSEFSIHGSEGYHNHGLNLLKNRWRPYIVPTIVLFSANYGFHIIRIIFFNYPTLSSFLIPRRTPQPASAPATTIEMEATKTTSLGIVEILSPHFLRITMPRPRLFHWTPGQSVYLTIPAVSVWQQHPFTVCGFESGKGGYGIRASPDVEKDPQESEEENNLIFLVRVRKGFTKELLKAAGHVEEPNALKEKGHGRKEAVGYGSAEMNVILDGPYSSPPWLAPYDSVLLIAGTSFLPFVVRPRRGRGCRREINTAFLLCRWFRCILYVAVVAWCRSVRRDFYLESQMLT
jgi:ferric-chelate reductase